MSSADDITVLAISSQVIYGSVGLSIAAPCLESLGIQVLPVPTVILASRPDLGTYSALEIKKDNLSSFLQSLEKDGWFERISGILTGYFLNPKQVLLVAEVIAGIKKKRNGVVYVCDPVLGDTPEGLYISKETAEAIKNHLLPIADLATPNLFEAHWLNGTDPDSVTDTEGLISLANSLDTQKVVITSADFHHGMLYSAFFDGENFKIFEQKRIDDVPKGAGDVFSALMMANILKSHAIEIAVERTLHQIERLAKTVSGEKSFGSALRSRNWSELLHKPD